MSEAITKKCPNPNCAWADFAGKPFPADCPDCSGTGRVPDVEATLRAEVARLKDVAVAACGLIFALRKTDMHAIEVAERAVVLALNATGSDWLGDIVRARNTPERIAELIVENEKAERENARLTAEVERLEGREREAADIMENDRDLNYSIEYRDESRAAWLAGCKS